MRKKEFIKAFKDTVPVMTGYIVLGMGFGIVMAKAGYGVWWTFGMSFFVFAGSMQYLAVDLLTGGASLITTALTTLMVNARHLFYGISMVDKYKVLKKEKPYAIFALTDETYSLVCSYEEQDEKKRRRYFITVSALDHFYWVAGSVIGGLIGTLADFNSKGVDFALTALFVTIFVDQWLNSKEHRAAVIGLAASVICLAVFGTNFLIPAMICIAVCLTVMHRVEIRREENV